ncbi:MAG: FAD-dependent pyridine nucleotide-disulfide oxidoreductase [Ignavibacteria bacterium]|nr:FAD-dependent pyridine nucleotide-disulfide oxidoreductase [Ignavibacteria bacterium]
MEEQIYKVAIIGAGPAGIAAAIQLNKYGIKPLILEKKCIGGMLQQAFWVENYPGFPKGISGAKLTSIFTEQLLKNNQVTYEEVIDVKFSDNIFFIQTNQNLYKSHKLILATGTVSKPHHYSYKIPPEAIDLIKFDISDLIGMSSKRIAIIGGGDLGFDFAVTLSKKNSVILFNKNTKPGCNISLIEEYEKRKKKIRYFNNSWINKIDYDAAATELMLQTEIINRKKIFTVNYLIFAIGRWPNLDLLKNFEGKSIHYLKEADRLAIIGDAQGKRNRQTGISIGDGLEAAMRFYCNSRISK